MSIKDILIPKKKNPQGQKWRRLDNTGKIFPLVTNSSLSNVFRIAVTLKEEIDPVVLQQALDDILPQFEGFRVRLKRGLFWYFFETNHRKITVEKEDTYPCQYISHKIAPYYLFRVSYYKNRINVEIYHALSDGLGAVNFSKLLACRYLQIKHQLDTPEIIREQHIKAETEDSYLKYYKDVPKYKYENKQAYHIEGKKLAFGVENIVHGSVPLKELKQVSKSYGVSITKYLTAVMIFAIYKEYVKDKENKPFIGVNLPINLRSIFNSETMANFFAVTAINYESQGKEVTFEDILASVGAQIDDQIVKEKLEEKISYNVSTEKKWYLKIVPLALKKLGMKLVFSKKDGGHTVTLSNLGPIKVEAPYDAYIESFYVLIGVSHKQTAKCAIIAYQDNLMITLSTVFDDERLSKAFFGTLQEQGISCALESNGVVDQAHDKGNYPLPQEISTGTLKKELSVGKVIMWYMVLVQLLVIAMDYIFGWERVSVNVCMPLSIMAADVIITALMYFHRVKWQSYFMYQISITIWSLIPILLVVCGAITEPFFAIMAFVVAVCIMALTIGLRRRATFRELIRRFHI